MWLVLACVAWLAGCADPAPVTGTLIVNVEGIESDGVPLIVVDGAEGFADTLDGSGEILGLRPGSYAVRPLPLVTTTGALYSPGWLVQSVTVEAGTSQQVTIPYAATGGGVEIRVTGLPVGAVAKVTVEGPTQLVADAPALVGGLVAGAYTITFSDVVSSLGDVYRAAAPTRQVEVLASLQPVEIEVTYQLVTATLQVSVTGPVPFGTALSVTGPSGFSKTFNASISIHGLVPGEYALHTPKVDACPMVIRAPQLRQVFVLGAGESRTATAAYVMAAIDPADLNLRVVGVRFVQAIQNDAGTIPVIAHRRAQLRVHGVADQCTSALASIQLTFPSGATRTLTRNGAVPTDASLASSSWTTVLEADLMTPDLTFTARIDPANEVAEADETDNTFAFDARASAAITEVPVFNISFVPITLINGGTTGNVTSANVADYLSAITAMYPLGRLNVTVRPPLAINVEFGNGNATAVAQVVSAIDQARLAAGSSDYWMGIVRPPAQAGAAMGLIGGKAAMAYDLSAIPPQAVPGYKELVAHELGHNVGRLHSPCGNPAQVDVNYPYPNAAVGIQGYDTWQRSPGDTVVAPVTGQRTDFMSYCNPYWISDYTFRGILDYRAAAEGRRVSGTSPTRILVMAGSLVGDALTMAAPIVTHAAPQPPATGDFRAELVDAKGRTLHTVSFAALNTHDPLVKHFGFSVPIPGAARAAVRVVVRAPNGKATVREIRRM